MSDEQATARRSAVAAIAIAFVAVADAVVAARNLRAPQEHARCGVGFVARGVRCRVPEGASCPAPLVAVSAAPAGGAADVQAPSGGYHCDAPDQRVSVPAAEITVGPSDWEAEGRVAPRVVRAPAFRIDAFEATRGRYNGATDGDAARAASGMTRAEAARFCRGAGGRLPTEDEWILAAVSARTPPRRYPWGDTGAVCRRAAWGLATGPCASENAARQRPLGPDELSDPGPDTVGAHPDGDTPLAIHDLAGNVAEWVNAGAEREGEGTGAEREGEGWGGTGTATGATNALTAVAKGGSWQSALAADLRIWARLELDPNARDPRVGFRCVYPP